MGGRRKLLAKYMIALFILLRCHTMNPRGVFMMLGCLVMCVFCHVGYPSESMCRLAPPVEQVMSHWTDRPLIPHR
jgi:hypothetical protein